MKLYSLPGSPNARKVAAVVHHLGLTVETEMLDFVRGDTRTDQFSALNPNQFVPVLVDGDLTLWESNAIIVYLAEKTGSDLMPKTLAGRADVMRWLFWEQAHFNKMFGILVFEGLIKPSLGMGQADPGLLAFARGELARHAAVLDARMAGRATVAGDGLTLADYALVGLEAYRTRGVFDFSPYAELNRYLDRVAATPAWRAVSPQPVAVAA